MALSHTQPAQPSRFPGPQGNAFSVPKNSVNAATAAIATASTFSRAALAADTSRNHQSSSAPGVPSTVQPSSTFGKGGGAQRSIDESLQVEEATGTFRTSFTVPTTAGHSGFGPSLKLAYDSGIGNGAFGLGWNLPLGCISSNTSKFIPKYGDSDIFTLSGADDLVPEGNQAATVSVCEGSARVQFNLQRF